MKEKTNFHCKRYILHRYSLKTFTVSCTGQEQLLPGGVEQLHFRSLDLLHRRLDLAPLRLGVGSGSAETQNPAQLRLGRQMTVFRKAERVIW